MNLLHMKYAVEIASTNSINKAAETLYVGQSALSRAIKELETSLGVTLFNRSAKGMFLTPDGEVFVRCAKQVLKQVEDMESMFSESVSDVRHFSISVPRASYITDAFAKFSKRIGQDDRVEMFYKETNALRAIQNILNKDYKLGIIRYAKDYDKYYKEMMAEKGLDYEVITEFRYALVMNAQSNLAKIPTITYNDLKNFIEIAHADPYVPSLTLSQVKKVELPDNIPRRIMVFERGSQFELLSQNPETFMWVSPIPKALLDRYNLIQRGCKNNRRIYNDVLIYPKGYTLSDLDTRFIEELFKTKEEMIADGKSLK